MIDSKTGEALFQAFSIVPQQKIGEIVSVADRCIQPLSCTMNVKLIVACLVNSEARGLLLDEENKCRLIVCRDMAHKKYLEILNSQRLGRIEGILAHESQKSMEESRL